MKLTDLDPRDPPWDALGNLFAAYLHRDFDLEHGENPWATIGAFRAENAPDKVAAAAQAARFLAHEASDEHEAQLVADRLSLDYSPLADGYTYRGWFVALADFLESSD